MNETFAKALCFEVVECANCGVPFAMTDDYVRKLRERGNAFHCPSGHSNCYGDSTIEKLRRQVEEKSREVTAAKCETLAEKQKREAVEADLKRYERRTKHGVCPCCRRTFVKLATHIEKAHPGYGPKQKRKLP